MTTPDPLRGGGRRWHIALLAALAYVPAIMAAMGRVVADTKLYLTLDPVRLMSDAVWTWDDRQFGGWVPHQNVGYLWPSGPWYALADLLSVPDWLAQRLWVGTIVFLAGLGVRWCARHLGLASTAALVAAVVYQCSPYVLPYISRTSVLLPPWAGLGWLVGLTVLATQLPDRRRWWPVAAFGLVVATVGGINATAMLMIAPGPVLYLLDAAARRAIEWRRAFVVAGSLAGVSLAVSLWWLVGLAIQARHGAEALAYSEALESTAFTSSAPEVLRGLGYWLFYVRDHVVPLTSASRAYMEVPALIAAGWILVLAGVAGLVAVRWPARRFAASLVLVGVVLSVGAHPVGDSSLLWQPLAEQSRNTLVLALRSSTRAVPLLLLGLALGAGVLAEAVARQRRRVGQAIAAGVMVLAVLNLPAIWTGAYADPALARPEVVSQAWRDVGRALDESVGDGRVLLLPGMESAAYRWGYTVDPPLPGLSDRPLITRDWLPLGSAGLMDVLYALDDRFQGGTIEPAAIAPVARLLGADTVLVANDVQFERFDTVRPELAWALYLEGVPGLGLPVTFGDPSTNEPTVDMVDDAAVVRPEVGMAMPPLAVFSVDGATDAARASPAVVLLSGSAEGVVDAAAAGLIQGHEVLAYSAALDTDDLVRAVDSASLVLVTDSNRARARTWRTSQDVWGFTEDGEHNVPMGHDPFDHRLPVFPDQTVEHQTIARQVGPVVATATGYGSPGRYWPEYRPARAVDGDLTTSWLVGAAADPTGEQIRLTFDNATAEVVIVQHQDPAADRWISSVEVTTEVGDRFLVPLDDRSRQPSGQPMLLPRAATQVTVEIATLAGTTPDLVGAIDPVGFAEIRTDAGPNVEVVRLPVDLAAHLDPDSPVVWVLTRERADPFDRRREDPERHLVRELQVPHTVDVEATVTVRLSPAASDSVLASLIGHAPALADGRAAGGVGAGGVMAVDGDDRTAWVTPFGGALGATLVVARADTPLDSLVLTQPVHGRSALVTEVRLSTGGVERTVEVAAPDAEGRSLLTFDSLPGGPLTLRISGTDGRTTVDRQTGYRVELPVAIASVEGSGIVSSPLPERVVTGCMDDVLYVDDRPVPISVDAALDDLLNGRPVTASVCEPGPLTLTAGTVSVRTTPGHDHGLDVDRVVLTSSAAGSADAGEPAAVEADRRRGAVTLSVGPCPDGCWLVQGDGWSTGWTARIGGESLGTPIRLGAGMNGWWLPPSAETREVATMWLPQRWMWWGLAASALAVLACIAVCFAAGRALLRRREPELEPAAVEPVLLTQPWAATLERRWWVVATTAVIGLAVIGPAWGLAAAVASGLACWLRRPGVAGLVGGAALAVAGGFVVVHQIRHGFAAGFGWPLVMERAHRPALFGILLVFATNLSPSNTSPPDPASVSSFPASTRKRPSSNC